LLAATPPPACRRRKRPCRDGSTGTFCTRRSVAASPPRNCPSVRSKHCEPARGQSWVTTSITSNPGERATGDSLSNVGEVRASGDRPHQGWKVPIACARKKAIHPPVGGDGYNPLILPTCRFHPVRGRGLSCD